MNFEGLDTGTLTQNALRIQAPPNISPLNISPPKSAYEPL